MRSIIDFMRAALGAAASFVYVFVRGAGETVGRWVRMLQPSSPAPEPARRLDEMLTPAATATPKPSLADYSVYAAISEVASALAGGQAPRAAVVQLIDNDTSEWLALLSPAELAAVGKLSTSRLRAHLTGRAHVPSLLRMSRAEMIERTEQLNRHRREMVLDEQAILGAGI